MIAVAIDGPAAAGKSTLSRRLAQKLGYLYIDTGALYRTVGLYMLRTLGGYDDPAAVAAALDGCKIRMCIEDGVQAIYLGEESVGEKIRTPEVSMAASAVSAVPAVRAFLLDVQKNVAKEQNVVMDGRDIGTVVLPDAQVKIFLSADARQRAIRRWEELKSKGTEVPFEEVYADLLERDKNDSSRDIAPLRPADDAVSVDTTTVDLDGALQMLYDVCAQKLGL